MHFMHPFFSLFYYNEQRMVEIQSNYLCLHLCFPFLVSLLVCILHINSTHLRVSAREVCHL